MGKNKMRLKPLGHVWICGINNNRKMLMAESRLWVYGCSVTFFFFQNCCMFENFQNKMLEWGSGGGVEGYFLGKSQIADLRASRKGKAFFKTVFPNLLLGPNPENGLPQGI